MGMQWWSCAIVVAGVGFVLILPHTSSSLLSSSSHVTSSPLISCHIIPSHPRCLTSPHLIHVALSLMKAAQQHWLWHCFIIVESLGPALSCHHRVHAGGLAWMVRERVVVVVMCVREGEGGW